MLGETTDPFAPLSDDEKAGASALKVKAPDRVPILPVPDDAPPMNFKMPSEGGAPTGIWAYRDRAGRLLGYDARFDWVENGEPKKNVRPVTFCQVGEQQLWRSKAFPSPRPLYGLEKLEARPDAPVVIAEGCKSTDAAGRLLPDYVPITWPGGSNATSMADWSVLYDRNVLIWPDRDRQSDLDGVELPYEGQPGTIAAINITDKLREVARTVRVLDLADWDCSDGWDAADALAEGWTAERTASFVETRAVTIDLTAAPAGAGGNRPVIRIRAGELHNIATEAECALIASDAPIYIRGGLVRPVVDEMPASHGHRTKVARLAEVDGNTLVDHLSRSADFQRFNVRLNDWVRADPPRDVAATIISRDGEWSFRRLAGVITAPTLRPDGSLLSRRGYDPATQLLLLDPPPLPPIPERPTRSDAVKALKKLDALLDGFPFVDDASRSVALSGLITPVIRGAMPAAPLHATSAPVAGSGKSYLVDLSSAILTGDRAPVIAAAAKEEETEKRLDAVLLNGQPIISIDNVNGQLGGDKLCQMIERPVVNIRVLGESKMVRIENRAAVFATGNNIQLVGDMVRRVLLCSLDPGVERPELRQFSTSPFDMIIADRGAYIAAALTVARAYIVAGFPDELPPLASFEGWSKFVRSALVWLDRDDPLATMEAARADDPVLSTLGGLLTAWHDAIGTTARSAGGVVEIGNSRDPLGALIHGGLHTALYEVAEDRGGGISAKRLGHYLKSHEGRVVSGLRVESAVDSHSKQKVWKVCGVCGDLRVSVGSNAGVSQNITHDAKNGREAVDIPANPRKPRSEPVGEFPHGNPALKPLSGPEAGGHSLSRSVFAADGSISRNRYGEWSLPGEDPDDPNDPANQF